MMKHWHWCLGIHKFPMLTTQFFEEPKFMALCANQFQHLQSPAFTSIRQHLNNKNHLYNCTIATHMQIYENFPLHISVGNYLKCGSIIQSKIQHCIGFLASNPTTPQHSYGALQSSIVVRKSKQCRLSNFPPGKSQLPTYSIDLWLFPIQGRWYNPPHSLEHPGVVGIITTAYNTSISSSRGEEIVTRGRSDFKLVIHTLIMCMVHRKWSSELLKH